MRYNKDKYTDFDFLMITMINRNDFIFCVTLLYSMDTTENRVVIEEEENVQRRNDRSMRA